MQSNQQGVRIVHLGIARGGNLQVLGHLKIKSKVRSSSSGAGSATATAKSAAEKRAVKKAFMVD